MKAKQESTFGFTRDRGVVWVCDIVNSTAFLNDNSTVEQIELYLPRLHWIAVQLVESIGGMLKWTGDGFIAWFPLKLHRMLGDIIDSLFRNIWTITELNNLTQYGLPSDRETFHLRHGVAVEHDALVMSIRGCSHESVDIIGRSVVLAFRMTSIDADFPNLVVTKDVLDALINKEFSTIEFAKLNLSNQDIDRHFKGEYWNVHNLYHSTDRNKKTRNLISLLQESKEAIKDVESLEMEQLRSTAIFMDAMLNGPDWARECIEEYSEFTSGVFGALKGLITALDKEMPNSSMNQPQD